MGTLSAMSYEEFGRMRFLDFFPNDASYTEDEFGGTDYGTGYAGQEGYLMTVFARQRNETTVISLEFAQDCPEREGHMLLDSLGLGLRKGMNHSQVLHKLGVPERDSAEFVRFVVGDRWPYLVCCSLDTDDGLFRVLIFRKDLVDKNEELL